MLAFFESKGTLLEEKLGEVKVASVKATIESLLADMSADAKESLLKSLNVVGTFTCLQGSDIVGDQDVADGLVHTLRLSVPQAKAEFVDAQTTEGTGSLDDVTLDFDEFVEYYNQMAGGANRFDEASDMFHAFDLDRDGHLDLAVGNSDGEVWL